MHAVVFDVAFVPGPGPPAYMAPWKFSIFEEKTY
jgi:hypothetical protein